MILHQRSMIKALSVIVDDITCDIIIDNCLCADSDHRWMSVDYPYGIAINNPFSNSTFFFFWSRLSMILPVIITTLLLIVHSKSLANTMLC